MSIRRIAPFILTFAIAGCGPQSPQEQQADRIREQADAQADQIESDARNEVDRMEAQAEQLLNQSGESQSFEAQRRDVRAKAFREEAKLIEKQASAQAKAVRDQGQAQASAVIAK